MGEIKVQEKSRRESLNLLGNQYFYAIRSVVRGVYLVDGFKGRIYRSIEDTRSHFPTQGHVNTPASPDTLLQFRHIRLNIRYLNLKNWSIYKTPFHSASNF
jgi:hypothetical protein